LQVVSLKVEMQENPQGVSTPSPRFSWQITSPGVDLRQQSYRIQVASSEEDLKKEKNLLWDSGIASGDESILIPYEGGKLSSGKAYYWRGKGATNQGE
ncbi:MAG TPA: alpha-rhamnosidase, partial [Porphyromonadaceae bacterium]|nr:alpha-rhamnosidase [Porphyromonadaceae bacterium]